MLYYVAPIESKECIERSGILTPSHVRELIVSGRLDDLVLGVSFMGRDASKFPEYVSLLEDPGMMESVAEQICCSRFGRYNDFIAIGYVIDGILRTHDAFVANPEVVRMDPDSYRSEVLYHGDIQKEFIKRIFQVRV